MQWKTEKLTELLPPTTHAGSSSVRGGVGESINVVASFDCFWSFAHFPLAALFPLTLPFPFPRPLPLPLPRPLPLPLPLVLARFFLSLGTSFTALHSSPRSTQRVHGRSSLQATLAWEHLRHALWRLGWVGFAVRGAEAG